MFLETPKFLQGVFPFEGRGLDNPVPFDPKLVHVVPTEKRVRPFYMRAGNSSPEMIYLVLMRDDKPMRYCPLGAKGALDVGFHVIEETAAGTVLEARFAAPQGIKDSVVVDVGLVEN